MITKEYSEKVYDTLSQEQKLILSELRSLLKYSYDTE